MSIVLNFTNNDTSSSNSKWANWIKTKTSKDKKKAIDSDSMNSSFNQSANSKYYYININYFPTT